MSARGLTRRALLATTAGTIAGGLIRPGGVLAALAGPPHPAVHDRWLGRLTPRGTTVELAENADLVGVEWQEPASAGVELRFRDGQGRWSRWVAAGGHGHGPDGAERSAAGRSHIGDPLWTGGVRVLQVRSSREMHGVRLHLVDVSGGMGARRLALRSGPPALSAALPTSTPLLQAGPGQPQIIARRGWAQGVCHPRVAPEYGEVRMGFVHHTESPNGYSAGEVPGMLRAIYAFHRYVNGWNDIGYNFVIDAYGRVFEARAGGIDESVVGAHAGGYNLVSTGVAMLGSFMGVPISAPARSALERLLAWKLSLHGLPSQGRVTVKVNPAGAVYSRFPANAQISLRRISGHRDADSTDCPGDVLYGELGGIRSAVSRLAPRPVQATLLPGPATATGATVAGGLRFLDGTPIPGAKILLQLRAVARKGEVVTEETIGEASTDEQGEWSMPATLPPGLTPSPRGASWLRALCTGASGYGAAVSPPLRVALAPAQATPEAPAPTPPAAAPPAG